MAGAPPALSLAEGWLATGETQGRWVEASDLSVGDAVRQADGTTGLVQAVVVQRRLPMYNLTVAVAHTFFVGDGVWLVHRCGDVIGRNGMREGVEKLERLFKHRNDARNALSERCSGSRSR